MTFDECVDMVFGWFEKAPEVTQLKFKNTTKENLALYHHTLGMSIRNECGLWKEPWTPWVENIVNGIDVSPNHPDAVSTRIMEAVWERVQNKRIIL